MPHIACAETIILSGIVLAVACVAPVNAVIIKSVKAITNVAEIPANKISQSANLGY